MLSQLQDNIHDIENTQADGILHTVLHWSPLGLLHY